MEMNWISVDDRLPEPEYLQEQVIIHFIDGLVISGWFDKEAQRFKDEHDGVYVSDVEHWMPLPAAPVTK